MTTSLRKLKQMLATDRDELDGIDPISAVLHLCGKYSFLPEIFELFGPEEAWKFVTAFGGRTIKVPSEKALQEAVAQLFIWKELRGSHDSQKETIKRLAARYDMKDSEVRAAAAKVQDLIDAKEEKRTSTPSARRNGRSQKPTEGTSGYGSRAASGRVDDDARQGESERPTNGSQEHSEGVEGTLRDGRGPEHWISDPLD